MLNIGGLNQGVVIDHIKAGHSMEIYQYQIGRASCRERVCRYV